MNWQQTVTVEEMESRMVDPDTGTVPVYEIWCHFTNRSSFDPRLSEHILMIRARDFTCGIQSEQISVQNIAGNRMVDGVL